VIAFYSFVALAAAIYSVTNLVTKDDVFSRGFGVISAFIIVGLVSVVIG
jgi:hypothetical protein